MNIGPYSIYNSTESGSPPTLMSAPLAAETTPYSSNFSENLESIIIFHRFQQNLDQFASLFHFSHYTPALWHILREWLASIGLAHVAQELRMPYFHYGRLYYAPHHPFPQNMNATEDNRDVELGLRAIIGTPQVAVADLSISQSPVLIQTPDTRHGRAASEQIPFIDDRNVLNVRMTLPYARPASSIPTPPLNKFETIDGNNPRRSIFSSHDDFSVSNITEFSAHMEVSNSRRHPPCAGAVSIMKRFCDGAREQLECHMKQIKVQMEMQGNQFSEELAASWSALQAKSQALSLDSFTDYRLSQLQQLLDKVEPEGARAIKVLETCLLKYSGNTLESLGKVAESLLARLQNGSYFYTEANPTSTSAPSTGCVLMHHTPGSHPGKHMYSAGFCGKKTCKPCNSTKRRPLQDVFECILPNLLPKESLWVCQVWYASQDFMSPVYLTLIVHSNQHYSNEALRD
jgi:hypothetical protein